MGDYDPSTQVDLLPEKRRGRSQPYHAIMTGLKYNFGPIEACSA